MNKANHVQGEYIYIYSRVQVQSCVPNSLYIKGNNYNIPIKHCEWHNQIKKNGEIQNFNVSTKIIYVSFNSKLCTYAHFKCRPWAKNSSPNTNDLYIHYMDKSTGTPSLEEKKALPNCGNKDGNIIHVLKKNVPPLLQQFWSVWNDWTHMYKSLVFVDELLAHLKSHQRCSAAFCRPVKFFHTDWIIISFWSLSYTQRHCHVRIEKGPVQTVAIKLEAHNFLEYHYMLKH